MDASIGAGGGGAGIDVMEQVPLTEQQKQTRRRTCRAAVFLTSGLQWPHEASVHTGITSPPIEEQEIAAMQQPSSGAGTDGPGALTIRRPSVDDVFRYPKLPSLPVAIDNDQAIPGLTEDSLPRRLPITLHPVRGSRAGQQPPHSEPVPLHMGVLGDVIRLVLMRLALSNVSENRSVPQSLRLFVLLLRGVQASEPAAAGRGLSGFF